MAILPNRISQNVFVKIKSMMLLNDLLLEQMLTSMRQCYKRETMEQQSDSSFSSIYSKLWRELLNEYIAELGKLEKTLTFANT